MEQLLQHVTVLNNFRENVENFIRESQEEFEKSGYKKIVEESLKKKDNSPFLSIVVRTQGRREESLREVFLCLEGQQNQDYEVLLIGHKLNEEQRELVQLIMEQQSDAMRKKIRFIPLDSGNRTTPLNLGFASAWGKYIVTLDDDDIVLDNWVSNFYNATKEHDGKVLYNYALAQNWSVLEKGDYKGALRAESAFDMEFARDYNEVFQVELNRCPPVGLAYPAVAFQKLGIIFDEELATTEDWDYLMRVAYVCGVHSIAEPACIYRKWVNAETSFTVHKQEEWARNYDTIVEKIDSKMMCLPAGRAADIFQLIKDRTWLLSGVATVQDKSHIFNCERMYISENGKYSEQNVVHAVQKNITQSGAFEISYLFGEKNNEGNIFRWDPIERGIIALKDVSVKIVYEDETIDNLTQDKLSHNGRNMNEYILFAQDDPQMILETDKKKKVKKIVFGGVAQENIPPEFYENPQKGKRAQIKDELCKIINIIKR